METYIIYAHTTDYGWSFEDEEPVLLTTGIHGSLRDSGLAYTFTARNIEDANKKAKEFIFYFEQEYVGESNIKKQYIDLKNVEIIEKAIKNIEICDGYVSRFYDNFYLYVEYERDEDNGRQADTVVFKTEITDDITIEEIINNLELAFETYDMDNFSDSEQNILRYSFYNYVEALKKELGI